MGIEQKLEQPEISTTNPELAELQKKAIEMAKYYYKGFGTTINGFIANGEVYLHRPERKELSEEYYEWLQEIDDFYARIQFNTLQCKKEFRPLFIVNRLLPQLRQAIDGVFKEKNEKSFRDLEIVAESILNAGALYSKSLTKLLREIRSFSEGKDFRVVVYDQPKNHMVFLDF